jgi:hypothetical protein
LQKNQGFLWGVEKKFENFFSLCRSCGAVTSKTLAILTILHNFHKIIQELGERGFSLISAGYDHIIIMNHNRRWNSMDLDNKVRTDDEDSNRLDFLDRRTAFEWLETYEGLGTTFRNLCIWLLSQAVGEKYARWMLGGNRREYAEWKRRMTEAAKKSGHPVLVDAVKARPELSAIPSRGISEPNTNTES